MVVVGGDDLGLLGVLLLHQVSYLRKTEGTAVTTGPTVGWIFPQAEERAARRGLNTCESAESHT